MTMGVAKPNDVRAKSLGMVISARRRELKLSQEEVAERVGGTERQGDVSKLERGQVALPRRDRLERYAAALDISVGELLARSGWTDADRYIADERPESQDVAGLEDLRQQLHQCIDQLHPRKLAYALQTITLIDRSTLQGFE